MRLQALLAILALFLETVAAEYSPGEFIPTARKGQFHGVSALSLEDCLSTLLKACNRHKRERDRGVREDPLSYVRIP
jgi:hypothetical protein